MCESNQNPRLNAICFRAFISTRVESIVNRLKCTRGSDAEWSALNVLLVEYEELLEFIDGANGYDALTEETAKLW